MAEVFDYAEMVAVADELIEEFGRQVSFIRTSATLADPTKPWRGENVAGDTRLDNKWAAVVPYESADDKDSVRFGVKMCIVSASQFPSSDGETFDQMIDSDGSLWHLKDADILNPGTSKVLYTFRCTQ